MDSPRPMAVVREKAKMEMSKTEAAHQRASAVPRAPATATSNGREAAATEPKTNSSATSVTGAVSFSARVSSLRLMSSMSRTVSENPPTRTSVAGPARSYRGTSTSSWSLTSLSLPGIRPMTSARSPPLLRNNGDRPADQ